MSSERIPQPEIPFILYFPHNVPSYTMFARGTICDQRELTTCKYGRSDEAQGAEPYMPCYMMFELRDSSFKIFYRLNPLVIFIRLFPQLFYF